MDVEGTKMELNELLGRITPPDEAARQRAAARWRACAKPLGSLGALETAIEDVAALTGSAEVTLSPRAVLVLCADNGVVAQGVTQTDGSVTAKVAFQLPRGCTAVGCMARVADCRVIPVDFGIRDFPGAEGVQMRRVGNGTADFTAGPAMTRAQAEQAIRYGIELVRDEAAQGTKLLAAGEMGIGNTTTAAAVASVLLGQSVEMLSGRGAGLSDAGLARKIDAIRRGIERNRPDASDALDVLRALGGFDIAGMCGVFLGGALYGVPVLVDGFISAVAALCALRLCPRAHKAMLASHVSAEPGGALVLRALGKTPLITAGLRLGEGTGAVAAMPLLEMALAVYRECYTFEDGGIEAYTPQEGKP